MALWVLPFLALAVAGLVLSLVAHVAALLGLPQPMGSAAWALHAGIIVVWLPAVLASRRLGVDPKSKDFWKVALRGCPPWVGWVTGGFFAYAVVNFLVFFVGGRGGGGLGAQPAVFRGFSGHWMAFYSAAAAMLYSALMVGGVADQSRAFGDRLLGRPGGEQAADYDDQTAPPPK
jgi:hypothetical protein